MIKLENLSKSFEDNFVIDNLNVDFLDNSITCVLSASGAGKTTMLRIISGLEKDYLGKVIGAGKVSVTFQEDRLFDWLTALQNIEIVSDSKTAKKLLEQMGLSAQADKYPNQLSGGMRRRISLAR
ncbi:MAG: ATP-binding cassette domain-containing protein, partial [Acutalibacteraceae bacterium]